MIHVFIGFGGPEAEQVANLLDKFLSRKTPTFPCKPKGS